MSQASHIAGGAAVEAALSVYLEAFATTLGSREQLAELWGLRFTVKP